MRDDQCALHSCDNHRCINPDHLRPGDRTENARDRTERDRLPKGTQCSWTRLTPEIVMEIFHAWGSHQSIADEHGVCRQHVTDIKAKKKWKHLHK